jgi:hypothetical protein
LRFVPEAARDVTPALRDAVVNDGRMATALLDNNVEDLVRELPST